MRPKPLIPTFTAMCDFSFVLGELLGSKPGFLGVRNGFHRTLDRSIVDGSNKVRTVLLGARDSLLREWSSRDASVSDGVHKICSPRARCGIPSESESDWQGLKAT